VQTSKKTSIEVLSEKKDSPKEVMTAEQNAKPISGMWRGNKSTVAVLKKS